jgi:hypothetical protein
MCKPMDLSTAQNQLTWWAVGSVLYLCICLLSSPKANYEISMSKERWNKLIHTNKDKHTNLYNLDINTSISLVTPTIK